VVVELSSKRALVAVFDGHGHDAALAARRARASFEQQAPACLERLGGRPAEGLQRLFETVHEELLSDEALAATTGVSVAAALVDAVSQTVTIAHVGDPKVVIASRSGAVEFETVQHFADAAAVAAAQGAAGGRMERPPERTGGLAARCRSPGRGGRTGLWVAHALGDWEDCSAGVRRVPSISRGVPLGPESVLVAASGAVWDRIGKEAAMHYASTPSTSTEASALAILRQVRREQSRAGQTASQDGAWQSASSSTGSLAVVIVRGHSL